MRVLFAFLVVAGAACGAIPASVDARGADAVPDAPGTVRVVDVTSTLPDGSYTISDHVPIAVTFSHPVTVSGTPHIAVTSGAAPIAYATGSGTATLTFAYTVAAGEHAAKLDATTLTLDGGAITSMDGNVDVTIPTGGAPGSLAANRAISIFTVTQTISFTGAMVPFVVPTGITTVVIDASGAQGGTSTGETGGQNLPGGKGAESIGTFTVSSGETLTVLAGGAGATSNCGASGGGGSFVVGPGNALLVAAGGGGGGFHCNALGGVAGDGGRTTTAAGDGVCDPGRTPRPGGTGGNGGSSYFGGGGGGFISAGVGTIDATSGGGVYPGAGGNIGGGFGGGGGHYSACCGGSGGGGGYSGGSGGTSDGCAGGGGGTMNTGTNATTTAGSHAGNGVVVIRY